MSHKIDTGIVLRGVVLPGTGWVLRDSRAWWETGTPDTPPRRHWPITQIVYHWSGGVAHVGPDSARRVVGNMKARKRGDGSLMSVSCHFVISWDGLVTQVADLAAMTIHAGRVLNRDGIGVEQCWPGSERQMVKLGATGYVQRRDVGGARLDCVRPSEAMLEASVHLAETLASLPESTKVTIPRRVPADTTRLRPAAAAAFRGVCEHAHSPGSEKVDCAGYVCDALAARGWVRG